MVAYYGVWNCNAVTPVLLPLYFSCGWVCQAAISDQRFTGECAHQWVGVGFEIAEGEKLKVSCGAFEH